jgi:hypothetical protein
MAGRGRGMPQPVIELVLLAGAIVFVLLLAGVGSGLMTQP